MSGLKVSVKSVQETPSRFELECDSAWWARTREALREYEVELSRPFCLSLTGYRVGSRLLFKGRLTGTVELSCVRCLEPVQHEFEEPTQLLLEPAPAGAEIPEGGIELDPEDAELGRYAGEELDFELPVLEMLSLSWPMQPLCREDCQGLCPGCGRNRNRESCACDAEAGSRPLAALGRLLEQSRRGGDGSSR